MNKRIAIFDYRVVSTNPSGGCHLKVIQALGKEYKFTVFSVEFENPDPECIEWVRIPSFKRPLALLFICYHLLAPICYVLYRMRHKSRFDIIQFVESNLLFGDICYSHFCHRAFLKNHWHHTTNRWIYSWFRWLDHWLHALVEPYVYQKAKIIIVPSIGLAEEIKREYAFVHEKIIVIPNIIDIEKVNKPTHYQRLEYRSRMSLTDDDVGLLFIALGHFERKGLPLILEALKLIERKNVRLLVVGGEQSLVRSYESIVSSMGMSNHVRFYGKQGDIKPFLWAADAFLLPSSYETFSLVSAEAAAAELPLLVTKIYGVEDYLVDGKNGILLHRSIGGIAEGINKLLILSRDDRSSLGRFARQGVEPYSGQRIMRHWRKYYESI